MVAHRTHMHDGCHRVAYRGMPTFIIAHRAQFAEQRQAPLRGLLAADAALVCTHAILEEFAAQPARIPGHAAPGIR
jgi:hypothetical protein